MRRQLIARARTIVLLAAIGCVTVSYPAFASPFGQGVFGADVPFGSDTSMSIALSNTITLAVDTPGSGVFTGDASHTITVTSTDVVGYRLYIYAPTTDMTNGSDTIATSANSSPGTLATNTWGYNTTGSSTDFMGLTTTPAVLKDTTGPHKSGDGTTVTYGVKVGQTKSAGQYTATVTYTAVGKSE